MLCGQDPAPAAAAVAGGGGRRPAWWCPGLAGLLAVGLLATGLGALFTFPGVFDQALRDQLVIREGTAAYAAWKQPDIPAKIRFYLFSIVNPVEFSAGQKPLLEEKGPFTFSEQTRRIVEGVNPDNGTISFKTLKYWHFLPEESESLEERVVTLDVPQFAAGEKVRGQRSGEAGMKMMFGWRYSLFTEHSARELLFEGYSDTLLTIGSMFAKGEVPMDKFGWFYKRNGTTWSDGTVNMATGTRQYEEVGEVREWKYSNRTHYPGQCGKVAGSTGFLPVDPSRQYIDYFSTDLCRPVRFERSDALLVEDLPATKYILRAQKTFGNVSTSPENSCYHANLPAGVHNSTGCKDEGILPVFISLPHYLDADPHYLSQLQPGSLSPDRQRHSSSFTLQEDTSIPLEVLIRFQIILQVRRNSRLGSNWEDLPENTFLPVIWFSGEARVDRETAGQIATLLNIPKIARFMGVTCIIVGGLLLLLLLLLVIRRSRHQDVKVVTST